MILYRIRCYLRNIFSDGRHTIIWRLSLNYLEAVTQLSGCRNKKNYVASMVFHYRQRLLLTKKLLGPGYKLAKLKIYFQNLRWYQELIHVYNITKLPLHRTKKECKQKYIYSLYIPQVSVCTLFYILFTKIQANVNWFNTIGYEWLHSRLHGGCVTAV